MGNYFSGDLELDIEPGSLKFFVCYELIKKYVLETLNRGSDIHIHLIDENYMGISFLDFHPGMSIEEFYKHRYLSRVTKYKDDLEDGMDFLYCEDDKKFFEQIESGKIDYYKLTINQIEISTNSKYFKDKDDESRILEIIEIFKQYKQKDAENYIGTIRDEDGTYRRDFWWDINMFKEELKNREFLCGNCKYNNTNTLCTHFDICNSAYQLGYSRACGDNNVKQ